MSSDERLVRLGFKFGKSGAHSARSLMYAELKTLLNARPCEATRYDYQQDIELFNRLHKSSGNARKLTFRHLVDLYGISPEIPLFRVFRQLWDRSEEAQPLLALQLALVRDPLLRKTQALISTTPIGQVLEREKVEHILSAPEPSRFSPVSLRSFAQNINGSWTQAGFLQGKVKKVRTNPVVTYVNAAFALFLGHCEGKSGQGLFQTSWFQLLGLEPAQGFELAYMASLHEVISYKQASGIVEVRFPLWTIEEN
ncbi:hypothetical protein HZI31_15410 [Serratia fonticola]|uniref:hypothetical protein n=1 Tax=Serratia fonticola TaxID=47917 RepID=UPI0015C65E70|nr:hypothetical protein [Serratia fonticola]NYA44686.1 hypothetical protein [Serratia fonticola]